MGDSIIGMFYRAREPTGTPTGMSSRHALVITIQIGGYGVTLGRMSAMPL